MTSIANTGGDDLIPMLTIADVKSTLLQYYHTPNTNTDSSQLVCSTPAYRKTSTLLVAFDLQATLGRHQTHAQVDSFQGLGQVPYSRSRNRRKCVAALVSHKRTGSAYP